MKKTKNELNDILNPNKTPKKLPDIMRVIKQLETHLTCEKFVVTGSVALSLMDIEMPNSKINDIDLVLVNPDESALEHLKKISQSFKEDEYPDNEDQFRFEYSEYKVDVFVADSCNTSLQVEGVYISGLMDLVNAKKKYGRTKDYLQLKYIADRIMNKEDFDYHINRRIERL